jgi:prophage regulatory protein
MDFILDRVVRRKQLLELIGLSCATQWRMEKAGQFPARIKLGKGSVGWHLTEVEAWLKDRERVVRQPLGGERLRRSSDRIAVGSSLLPLGLEKFSKP